MADIGPGKQTRSGETEYGGEVGRIQRGRPDLALEHTLDAQEKAAVMRGYGIRAESGEVRLDGTPWPEGVRRRDEARERLSGREVDEAL
jgi:hypothetical protein